MTKKPKLQAAKELMEVVDLMTQTDTSYFVQSTSKESFVGALELWFTKWEAFLNERTVNETTKKSSYTHKNLRSAYTCTPYEVRVEA